MLGFLIIVFPILEIYTFVKVGQAVGFANVFFALLAGFVLGLGIAKAQGRYILARLKGSIEKRSMPTNDVQHGLVVFIAGVLIAIPGFLTDLVGILLLIPGTRHLFVRLMRSRLESRIRQGGFEAFTFGQFGGGAFGGGFGTPGPRSEAGGWEREVSPRVIDVSPLKPRPNTDSRPKSEN